MFLTPDEIATLTGYKRHADQRGWLQSHGWVYEQSAGGRPIVSRAYAEQRMGVAQQEVQPDFSFLGKAA